MHKTLQGCDLVRRFLRIVGQFQGHDPEGVPAMVVRDESVIEAEPDQRQMKVVDGSLRQSLYVAAQFIGEVPDPPPVKHGGGRRIRPF